MIKKSAQQNKKGFSLTEMVVVVGIILVLAGIFSINWRSAREDFLLQRSAHELVKDIRRALEMTMSLAPLQGGTVPDGYGIYFGQNNDSYTLYADRDNNERYDETIDTKVEIIYFETGVKIESLSRNNLSINFKPPNPTVNIGGGDTEATITITLESNPLKTKRIKVNKAGLVYVE